MKSPVLFLLLYCAVSASTQTSPSASNPSPAAQAVSAPATQAAAPAPAKAGEDAGTPSQKPDSDALPTTVIFDKSAPSARSTTTDGSDALFEPPPLPKGNVALIGGTVRSIDRVRNRISVQPFDGKSMTVRFDDRTHIYRDGVETTQLGIRKGDRIYVDTMLDHSFVLARSVRVITELQPADARGQLTQFNDRNSTMVVQDELSHQSVRFQIDGTTQIKKAGKTGSMADLAPGSLIAVRFAPDKRNRGVAREVTIYASPGATYTFAGEITHLNLSTGTLAIHNLSDDRSYDIEFDPAMSSQQLQLGAQATIQAQFTGRNYKAAQIQVTQAAAKEQ
jgi:Domain of unknown function (DUF5666)